MQHLPTQPGSPLPRPPTCRQTRRPFGQWPRSPFRRALFGLIYLLFLGSLLWGGSWAYLSWKVGKPLSSRLDIWEYFYPELHTSGVLTAEIRTDDDSIDVLMLGASTINRAFGDVEARLKAGLQREFGERVRIYNLAKIAHTSRDSATKYSRIKDRPFDVIVIYDGFNDCRMNNCVPGSFRDDYTHCAWYNGFRKRQLAGTISLPQELMGDVTHVIGIGEPDQNLMQYGGELKTPGPFRHNLEEILTAAQDQHSLVVLQTFAYHIPADYTLDKFVAGKLDYGSRSESKPCPLHMWGRPRDIARCVETHNQVIRDLAREHPQRTLFVDQDRSLSHTGKYFVDGCHFTDEGCRQFVDNLLPSLIQRLRDQQAASRK